MPTTKKSKNSKKKSSSAAASRSSRLFVAAGLVIVVVAVAGFALMHGKAADSTVSASKGTVDRSDQIDTSELNQESAVDNDYDTQQSTNAQTDAASAAQVGEGIQNED